MRHSSAKPTSTNDGSPSGGPPTWCREDEDGFEIETRRAQRAIDRARVTCVISASRPAFHFSMTSAATTSQLSQTIKAAPAATAPAATTDCATSASETASLPATGVGQTSRTLLSISACVLIGGLLLIGASILRQVDSWWNAGLPLALLGQAGLVLGLLLRIEWLARVDSNSAAAAPGVALATEGAVANKSVAATVVTTMPDEWMRSGERLRQIAESSRR